jgi:hypothetical protein
MIARKLYLFLFLFSFSLEAVEISGTIHYERVHAQYSGGSSLLNYSNITQETAKQVMVLAIDRSNNLVDSTFTNNQGRYTLSNITSNSDIKIRVYAKMEKLNRWDVKVIDNSDNDALYGIEGGFSNSGFSNSVRNLTASASNKSSPPFAILDSIYLAMNKVYAVDSNVNFPLLKINWSINNITSGTYYDGVDNIVLQGDQQGDSDEYDDHIVIHEWGHYFERSFSRADNIGGSHGSNEHLDIRVAFGEGFGNALSAMVTDDPLYFDTFGSNGWNMNMEHATHETPGWFSEASIQRILYDLYDSNNDGTDRLSLGFKPMYETLVNGQQNTSAFTSIFSFINELKKANPSSTTKIDDIIANEDIATIEDSYGSNRVSNLEEGSLPLYRQLTVDKTIGDTCSLNHYGSNNKLANHKYVRFSINRNDTYPIQVKQSNGSSSDPEFILFKTSPFEKISTNESGKAGIEKASLALTSGDYLLDIYDANNIDKACFSVSVGQVTSIDNSNNNDNDSSDDSNTNTNTNTNDNTSSSTSTIGFTLPDNIFLAILILLTILFIPLFFIRKELKL